MAGAVGWYVVVYPAAQPPILWAALGYVLLLASTAGCATGLAIQAPAHWPLAIGTGLFFISDLMIALEQFGGVRSKFLSSGIWLTYGPAQALIVYSTATWLQLSRKRIPGDVPGVAAGTALETAQFR